jgi:hypothetical protein
MRKWHGLWLILACVGLLTMTSCSPSDTTATSPVSPSPVIQILNLAGTPECVACETSSLSTAEAALSSPTPLPTITTPASPEATFAEVSASTAIRSTTMLPETPAPTETACTNRAAFIRHLTVNDHTAFMPGISFGKMWRIQNTGTCTWTTEYTLVFSGGESMGAPDSVPLPQEVKPGETVDLRVSMIAPEKPQEYNGQWMLRAPWGETFGVGETADQALVVLIVVRPSGDAGGFASNCT